MKRKKNLMQNVKKYWILFLVLSSIIIVTAGDFANRFGLIDSTVVNETSNICIASRLGMTVTTFPCRVYDSNGQDIVQFVDFRWDGVNPQEVDWIFAYPGDLISGRIDLWNNTEWFDVTNQVIPLGGDILQNYSLYQVRSINFNPGQVYQTRWQFTPRNSEREGKWIIFGKRHSDTIQQARTNGIYLLMDPWWNGTTGNKVYDDFDDSSINSSLWNQTITQSISDGSNSWSEDTAKMTITSSSTNTASYHSQTIRSTNLTSIQYISNLTFHAVLTSTRTNGGGASDCATETINVFGSQIKQVQKCDAVGSTIDNSVWTLLRNTTAGVNVFDVYDDGVKTMQINGTDNILSFSTNAEVVSVPTSTSTIEVYYVHYRELGSITLQTPSDNSNITSRAINFTCFLRVVDGNNITNVSLYGNWSGGWGIKNTTNLAGQNLSSYNASFYITSGISDLANYKWNCEGTDTSNTRAMALSNFSFYIGDVTPPNLTIVAPNGTYSNITNIPINISVADNVNLSYCFYNVTRGASLEVANTQLANCGNSTFTVSGDATYIAHVCANDTSGNMNCTNSTFITSGYIPPPSSSQSGGGGGGSFVQDMKEANAQPKVSACEPFGPALPTAFDEMRKASFSGSSIKKFWNAFWDVVICRSAASIIIV